MRRTATATATATFTALAMAGLLLLGSALPALAAGARSQVSFTQAQQYFMCTACHEALNVARSPEAFNENAELRRLIKRGDSIDQIKRGMVDQYGAAVLADPPKHGFAVLLVVIPIAVLAAGVLTLLVTIPRWRRRAGAGDQPPATAAPGLSDVDAERLDADLARHL